MHLITRIAKRDLLTIKFRKFESQLMQRTYYNCLKRKIYYICLKRRT